MVRRGRKARAAELRGRGVRVAGGPWVVFAGPGKGQGRLVAALGKSAGPAVTRSRIRRIARNVVRAERDRLDGVSLLLLARGDASRLPRRTIRAGIASVLARIPEALARARTRGGP
jgi:ribonuclease P protein component